MESKSEVKVKVVNIYVLDTIKENNKDGKYDVILSSNGKTKVISKEVYKTSQYRVIIQGAIDSIKLLKEPCVINLYTTVVFGMSKIRNKNNTWKKILPVQKTNMDLLAELQDILIKGQHEINNYYSSKDILLAFKNAGIYIEQREDKKLVYLKLEKDLLDKLHIKNKENGDSNIVETIKKAIQLYVEE